MALFQPSLSLLIYASSGFVVAEIYLTLNKLWSRKHEPQVVESISPMSKLVGLVPVTVFAIDGVLRQLWVVAIVNGLWIMARTVQLLIGIGLWEAGRRRISLWVMLRRALSQERSELGDLLKALVRPTGARQIVDILGQLVTIDGHLDQAERELIQTFANHWQISLDWQAICGHLQANASLRLRSLNQAVTSYLELNPPKDQARQLADLSALIIRADGKITVEEEITLAETTNQLNSYVHGSNAGYHYVNIVTRSDEQAGALMGLLDHVVERQVAGGTTYLAGPYFSDLYAEQVAKQYRALGFFAIMLDKEGLDRLVEEELGEALSVG
jgi:hypothetical protein